jgi:hypothetical protein
VNLKGWWTGACDEAEGRCVHRCDCTPAGMKQVPRELEARPRLHCLCRTRAQARPGRWQVQCSSLAGPVVWMWHPTNRNIFGPAAFHGVRHVSAVAWMDHRRIQVPFANIWTLVPLRVSVKEALMCSVLMQCSSHL